MTDPESGEQVAGHYAVGWIKRGPSGVIGTNKKDALETVDIALRGPRGGADTRAGEPVEPSRSRSSSPNAARRPRHLSSAGRRSTAAETAAGEPHGRPRIKFCRVDEMVEASRSASPAG